MWRRESVCFNLFTRESPLACCMKEPYALPNLAIPPAHSIQDLRQVVFDQHPRQLLSARRKPVNPFVAHRGEVRWVIHHRVALHERIGRERKPRIELDTKAAGLLALAA